MKLAPLSLLLASVAVATVALAGCGADPTVSEDDDAVESSEAEITSLSAKFLGSYEWRAADSGDFVDFKSLELKKNGRYDAEVESGYVNPGVRCVAFPCTLPESGVWFAYRSYGQTKIRVYPAGGKPSRSYYAVKPSKTTLRLRRFGATTTLFAADDLSACAAVLCGPNTTCQVVNGEASCVPTLTCANVLCAPGHFCEMQPTGPVCTPQPACRKTGCSGHVCADSDRVTTCEFRPEYACYQAATCERQADGQCGFTKTDTLTSCLEGVQ